jgi:hypothetical protein
VGFKDSLQVGSLDEVVFQFNERDITEVNSWYKKRGLPEVESAILPKNGFICHGVAAIFVYLTDSNIAMVEGLISNPDVSPLQRGRAVRSLVDAAYAFSLTLRKKVLVILNTDSVNRLALSLGYKSIGTYELLIKG